MTSKTGKQLTERHQKYITYFVWAAQRRGLVDMLKTCVRFESHDRISRGNYDVRPNMTLLTLNGLQKD